MRGNDLLDKMELVDPSFVEEANMIPGKRKNKWVKLGAIAACLCLVIMGFFALTGGLRSNQVQVRDEDYTAEDYFKYCNPLFGGSSSQSTSFDYAPPYDKSVYFSDQRTTLENDNIIPVIDSHPLFNLAANYNEDGSLYSVMISWQRRDLKGIENYSDLQVTAAHEEVSELECCVVVETDSFGNVIEPAITVTERNGIQIVAEGRRNQKKTLTFEKDSVWYQISGSWNDDYESVVELLDWFWEHPLDLEQFSMDAGDEYTYTTLSETPDAFSEYLPDFASFGFIERSSVVVLKNGVPVSYEGQYVAHVTEEQVKDQSFYHVEGYTTIHWCINAEPDVYDLKESVGKLEDLTREKVMHLLEKESSNVKFEQDGMIVTVYAKDSNEAWMLIEAIQK